MNTNMMREPLAESQAGKLIFPEVVRRLLEAGVESYFAIRRREKRLSRRATVRPTSKKYLPVSPVAKEFFFIRLDRRDRRGPNGYEFTKAGWLRGAARWLYNAACLRTQYRNIV